MADIIYLILKSYISYTKLDLIIQDGRHNSKWPPNRTKNEDILTSRQHSKAILVPRLFF